MGGHPGTLKLVSGQLARLFDPPAAVSLSAYLAANLVLIDGPRAGQLWDPDGAPYLPEIADCLGDDHPCNLVTVRKAQQTGASILALGWCLYIADCEPANTLYGVPGLDALRDLNGQKLQPLIEAWQRRMRRTVIVPQTSRSGTGSTTYEKRFAGGYLGLANANSAMDLSSKTIKKGVKDELSKWQDIPGFGDPETLFHGRLTAFRRTQDYKVLEISTPEVDVGDDSGEAAGHCRIDRSFKRSDQRYWNCLCPKCERLFVHDIERLRIDYERPQRSRYECRCGHLLSEAERVVAVRSGRWIPSVEGEGRHPGFHIDAFVSLMMSYGAIAEDKIKAEKGTEKDRKDFANLVLGRPYRFKGDAPDHRRLFERREDWLKRYHVPARGLLLVGSADVQMRGIWYEILAVAPNRETWVVDAGYISGDTSSPHGPVFEQLKRETVDRTFPDAFGRRRPLDAFGIDSGYRTHVVYAWVHNHQRRNELTRKHLLLALDGRDGWRVPAIGTPSKRDIDLEGRKIPEGVDLWPVGTWSLKATFYDDLKKDGIRSGKGLDPDGYCHFGMWQDEEYFRQITAEYLTDVTVRGKVTGQRWDRTTENHLLDCRIYNLALAEYLGLSTMSPEEWAALAQARGLPDELTTPDLFTPRRAALPPTEAPPEPEPPPEAPQPEPEPAPADGFWGRSTDNWFER